MLNLNIKSSSYMCLDIDPSSVIHKHLVKKITDESWGSYTTLEQVEKWRLRSPSSEIEDDYHNLTILPNFHISLGAPGNLKNTKKLVHNSDIYTAGIVGNITLAPICISKKDNKKSAWIPLHPYFYTQMLHQQVNKAIERNNYQPYGLEEEDVPYKYLHISLANLTGNPHDSIARPENCIIDTITA